MSYAFPILFIIVTWWFSTGAVLWFSVQSDGESRVPLLTMAAVGIAGLVGVYYTSFPAGPDAGTGITYLAVISALAVWAFVEFTFLTGIVTGSSREVCPKNISERERFRLAFHAISYHEYALVAALMGVGLISLPGGHMTAFATFALLWIMRISAKLTLFSGAPKFSIDMMPSKLAYLQTYFRHDRIGPVFWLSTLLFTANFIAAIYGLRYGDVALEYKASAIMLTTLLGLGVLEHWFMVLPVADGALWRWALPRGKVGDTHKTTLSNKNGEHTSGWLPRAMTQPVGIERKQRHEL